MTPPWAPRAPLGAWKGIHAGGLVLASAGCAPELADTAPTNVSDLASTAGVVVIGAGPGGMAAAMDLPGSILLEASDRVGGRAPGWPGLMMFVGTREQQERQVVDSVEMAMEDWTRLTGAAATSATRAFLEQSAAVRDRLVDMGLSFGMLSHDPVTRRDRMHSTTVGLDSVLFAGLPQDVDLRLNTRATGLLIEDDAVVGVQTDDDVLPASVVIIASGGFVNRPDLVARFTTWAPGTWAVGEDPGAQGDAVDWADAWSLGLARMDTIGTAADAIGVAGADGQAVRRAARGPPPWILVDASGARFIDETQYWSVTVAGQVHAHAPVWALTSEMELRGVVDPDLWERVLSGCTCADDWGTLAEAIGVDPDGLAWTLAEVAGYTSTNPDPFGRGASSMPALNTRPCAFPPGLLANKNFGGLDVDFDGRVLDADGRAVRGLWAVGEAAGMGVPGMGGLWGFDGALSAVVWSGWRTAAAIRAEQDR